MAAPDFEVDVAGGTIAGWRSGDGPEVLVLHGGPGLSEYTQALLPELGDGYTVVRYQQRGVPPSLTTGPFTIETQVADALAVMDRLALSRPLVIGHSWGGHLLLHLMAAQPNRVRAALVVDPLGVVPDGGEADLGRILGERASPEAAARAAELDERALRGEGSDADALEGLSLMWPGYFADPSTAPPMPPIQLSVAAYAATFASIHDHFERQTLVSRLPQVHLPVLFLLGGMSPIPTTHGVASATLIPGAEVQVLDAVGHFPWLEEPGSVRRALDHLTELAGRAG